MAIKYYSTWNGIISATEKEIKNILTKDIKPVGEKILKEHIKTDIYVASTNKGFPRYGKWVNGTTYQRRHVLENSIWTDISPTKAEGGFVLTVTSNATASPSVVKGYSFHNRYPGSFLKLLESGNLGIWRSGFPRPVISNTQDDFNSGTEISKAITEAITRRIGKATKL